MRLIFVADIVQCSHRIPLWCEELSYLGVDVTLVTPKYNRYQENLINLPKVPNYEIIFDKKFKSNYKRFPSNIYRINRIYDKCKRILFKNYSSGAYFANWGHSLNEIIKEISKKKRIDYLIVSVSPFTLIPIIKEISENLRIDWIIDYRDLWSQNHNLEQYSQIEIEKEKRLIRNARGLITVNEGFAIGLNKIFKNSIYVCENGFKRQQQIEKLDSNDLFNIVYTGNIYENKQDIFVVINALININQDKTQASLEIVGPNSFYFSKIVKKKYGAIPPWLKLLNEVTRADSYAKQSGADLLLILGWNDRKNLALMVTKFYEYLNWNHPILISGGHSDSQLTKLAIESGLGFWADNVKDAQVILETLINTRGQKLDVNKSLISRFEIKNLMKNLKIWLEQLSLSKS